MKLWYKQCAEKWEETLPIGNGSLGAMIWGNPQKEMLGLNEESLWSGYPHDKNNPKAALALEKVRQLIFDHKFKEAENIISTDMLGEYGESYLPLGNLMIEQKQEEALTDYYRDLDIEQAIAHVSFKLGEKLYTREYFASYPHHAIFMEYTGVDMELHIQLDSALKMQQNLSLNGIDFAGQCPEHLDPNYVRPLEEGWVQGHKGKLFHGKIQILSCDGTIEVKDKEICIVGATKLQLAISCEKEAILEPQETYEEIKKKHIQDYQAIYNKVELCLGEQLDMPTDERLQAVKAGKEDNGLFGLLFQYGRYMLIASSREGCLPANLQGIWSWQLQAPWSSNWTTNINVQMNYWPAQSCNLSECMEPYYRLIERICANGQKTASTNYACRGFVHHHNADYWCNTNPTGMAHGADKGQDGAITWSFWPMGGGWLVQELFRNYEYNQDIEFLRNVAYPLIKEAALFMVDWLVEHNGYYTTCPSTSPENRYLDKKGNAIAVTEGSAMDLEIIREVFGDYQKTCEILGIKEPLLAEIKEKEEKLQPLQIGSRGQLLEWHEEFRESEPGHRHLSQLYGLFPSELFAADEKWIQACRTSLEYRLANGGGYTGWSCAWIINMFAILREGEKAFEYLKTLLTRSVYPNLWDAHPPFQIDGNFGATAGIANMLVQDRGGKLQILPALPKKFANGYVKGLRIKNKQSIDITWKDGKLDNYQIHKLEC